MKAQADALGVLIRAGVDPEQAADKVGLTGINFAQGLMPTTLKPIEG